MTDRFYQRHLDVDPVDAAARLLLAEFFAEHGDPATDGYRWLAEHAVLPQDYSSTHTWDWNDDHHFDNLTGAIPHVIFMTLSDGRLSASESYREYPTREAAERAFAKAMESDANRPRLEVLDSAEP